MTFDPRAHLIKLKGKDYLEVKWRLVWLRDENPDASVRTYLHTLTDQKAVFSAEINIPGAGSATGWGSETPNDFADYLEKAETKALGRALAALGYGTQFTDDWDEGSGNVVDAPVQRSQPQPMPPAQVDASAPPMTQSQMDQIIELCSSLNMTPDQAVLTVFPMHPKPLAPNKYEAKDVLVSLRAEKERRLLAEAEAIFGDE